MPKTKSASKKGLSHEVKIWWILNAALLLQAMLFIASELTDEILTNNYTIHLLYNLTSIIVILPLYIVAGFAMLLFGFDGIKELFDHFQSESLMKYLFAALVGFMALAVNYLYARILTSKPSINLYLRYIKPHPFVVIAIIVVILYLFATN